MKHNVGVGATPDLSLRVSVATLVRVIFKHPINGEWMLALERKATLHEDKVEVKSQPFGGAIRILDVDAIRDLIGDFHFDSDRSRTEQDFRLFIQPSSWSVLREFCIQHLSLVDDPILETDPVRELVEEFGDTLQIDLKSEQYTCKPVATLIENESFPTENVHAKGYPTVRIYRIFEVFVRDSVLAIAMLNGSESVLYEMLCALALKNARNGGRGWANAILVFPLRQVTNVYQAISPAQRNFSITIDNYQLDETVSAILDEVVAPKYQMI